MTSDAGQKISKIELLDLSPEDAKKAMARELLAQRDAIAAHLDVIRQRAGTVAVNFRDRLHERVRALLAGRIPTT